MATLEEVFVPVYFFHRYQVEAAVKLLGGLNYRYALRGDGQPVAELLTPAQQTKAITTLTKAVEVEALMIPESILQLIPPRALGYQRHRELIKLKTGLTFDPIAAAESAADMTYGLVFLPARANRLVEHHARVAAQPSLEGTIDQFVTHAFKKAPKTGYEGAVQMAIDGALFFKLANLAVSKDANAQTKAITLWKLEELRTWLHARIPATADEEWKSFYTYIASAISRLKDGPEDFQTETPLDAPPGMPIGAGEVEYCSGGE